MWARLWTVIMMEKRADSVHTPYTEGHRLPGLPEVARIPLHSWSGWSKHQNRSHCLARRRTGNAGGPMVDGEVHEGGKWLYPASPPHGHLSHCPTFHHRPTDNTAFHLLEVGCGESWTCPKTCASQLSCHRSGIIFGIMWDTHSFRASLGENGGAWTWWVWGVSDWGSIKMVVGCR